MMSFGTRRTPTQVYLNVYDLAPANHYLYPVGFGIYHTGVEISGSEYTFASEGGVFHHTPKAVPQASFREQICMGCFDGGQSELKAVVDALGNDKFGPSDYSIFQNNCNHFANALCLKLVKKPIPGYINRIADIGNCCSCLIPKRFLERAPVNQDRTETSSFLVRAPMNRGGNTATTVHTAIFAGTGSALGGTSQTSNDSLTDRREKARAAALARLEKQLQQPSNDCDKSL